MKFFAIHLPKADADRIERLKSACKKLKIEFCPIDPFSFDFSKPPSVKKGDIVYRVGRGKILRAMEDYCMVEGAITFYINPSVRSRDPFLLTRNNIPTPRTIFCTVKNPSRLKKYVDDLGGFPIIVKALGGTHGLGVMKVDSFESLISIAEYFLLYRKFFKLQQFIPVKTSARLIVLGGRVISSIEYRARGLDFRTNQGKKLTVKIKKYSKSIEALAVRATKACGVEFGGVDILIHKGKCFVTEVNFPCNFIRAENVTGHDIAKRMVEYLKEKSVALRHI